MIMSPTFDELVVIYRHVDGHWRWLPARVRYPTLDGVCAHLLSNPGVDMHFTRHWVRTIDEHADAVAVPILMT